MTTPGATRHLRVVVALALSYMLFAVLLNSVGTLILQSQRAWHVGKEAVGTLDAFKDLPIAVVSFCVASLLPRFGYRKALMLALAIVAAACAMMPLFDAFWMVCVLLAASGAAFALVKTAVYSSIGLLAEDAKQHASLTSSLEGWFMVGVLLGPWVFSAFIGLQSAPEDAAWLDVYGVLAAVCVAIIALLATTGFDESAAHVQDEKPASFFDLFRLLALPLVGVFLFAAFLYVLIEQGVNTWLPSFNANVLKLPAAASVQMASLFAACIALGRLGAGIALRWLRWDALLMLCLCVVGVLILFVLPLAERVDASQVRGWWSAPLAAWLLPLIGLFLAPVYPAINSFILSRLPKPKHAAMTGLIVLFSALGGSLGSYVTGRLFARLGGQHAFELVLLPLAALLALVFLLGRKRAE